jgi:hypothetical protein
MQPFWMLPATVVWVATRAEDLANPIWNHRGIYSAYDVFSKHLSEADGAESWRAALDQLTVVLVRGDLRAHGVVNGCSVEVAPEAWMMPILSGPQGLVVGATLERLANGPAYRRRVVGGIAPIFASGEVMAAFPADGIEPVPGPLPPRPSNRQRIDHGDAVQKGIRMIKLGMSEHDVRRALRAAEVSRGVSKEAARKRVSDRIMPEIMERLGK